MEEEIKTQVEKIKDLSEEIGSETLNEEQPLSEAVEEIEAEIKAEEEKPVKKIKPFAQWPVIRWFVNNSSAGKLIGKSLLLLAIPYVYLFILSWIFDSLKKYEAAGFILYSTIFFWVINLALIVYSIIRFAKSRHAENKKG